MRVTKRFAVIALWACFLAALPSFADSSPSAQLRGYRCEVLRDGEAPSGTPVSTVLVCQIVDDGGPISPVPHAYGVSARSNFTLDSLLNLLTLLDNARHDASLQRHDAVVPRPTP
jgi:hypothetical protein